MVTPLHIVPEWYFLPFYAILRSIPDKLFGVIFMIIIYFKFIYFTFFIILILKYMHLNFRPFITILFLVFFSICLLLGWIGSQPAQYPYIQIGQILTIFYFSFFFIYLPFIDMYEEIIINKIY